ncbi:DUF5801 repeats-in-toxin domain-containing protein [Marinomonas lutimaris]|uniref:DUF5801 repeats-in-toxin domain-containing protein n=1 Tax=Marinomonas lutimaris TaxID=2846746 RepID=UPI001C684E65
MSIVSTAVNADGDTVIEGQGAVFTVTLSNESTSDQTYDFSLTNGTAGSDDYDTDLSNVTFSGGVTYDADSGKITVPAGVTEFTATVATTDDTIDEANETFTLNVGGESGTATIIDNDLDTPKVSIIDDVDNDEFISKAELGDDNVQVEVAVNGEKLQLGGVVTLTIANGDGQERTVSLSLNVNGDLVDENGTPQISFSYSDGVIAWTENVMDGDAITVSAFQTDAHGNQSAIGADTATVDITATEAPTVTITEDVNNDGVISNAELVGKVNVEIGLPTGAVAGDTLTVTGQEPMVLTEEQITAGKVQFEFDRLKDGSTLVVDATVTDKAGNVSEPGTDSAKFDTLTIAYINDNGAPIEGDNAEFIVTLTQATSSDVTIKLLPTFDSAASADDVDLQNMTASYVNSSGDTVMLSITENGNVTIPAGVISINISIPIVDDAIVEGVEHFKLAIKGVDGVVASDSATIGIIDNDFSDGDENVSTAEDHVTSGNVLNNVTNLASIFTVSVSSFTVNGQTYSLTDSDSKIATISGVGTFTLSADGGYSFIPEQDYNGSVPDISYTVTNGSGTDVTSTLSIEVTAVDDVTVTVSDKGLTNEDTTLSVNAANGVLSNDSDVDSAFTVATYSINNVTYQAGDTVVVKGSGDDSDKDIGSLTLRADGSYEFVPAADWSGDVPTVSYTTSTGESADLDINVVPVADAPKVELTITASESNEGSNTGGITQVNGGSGQPGGFDVQNGQIIKIGDGVRVWLTKGDSVPEIANPDSEHPGVVEYYGDGNPHGSSSYADIFVVHPDSGWFYTQSDWNGREELRDLNSVLGGSVSQQSPDAMKDYIFLSGDTTGFDVSFGPNNRNGNFNTIDSIVVKYDNQTLISGSNQIEGVIYGNGTLDGPNQDDTTIETIATSQEFLVDVSAELTDTDGSETLSGITLSGIPDGVDVELVGARAGVTLTLGDTGWVISNPDGKDLTGIQLKMTVPQNSDAFTIRAEAITTEKVGGSTAVGSYAAEFVDTDTVPTITVNNEALAKLNVLTDDSDLVAENSVSATTTDFSKVFDIGYGTDGRGDVAYEIKLAESSVATGFTVSRTGEEISLSLDGGKLVGLTESGTKVFEVTVDGDGKVSMIQYQAVSHPDTNSSDEQVSLKDLGVKLAITAADGDSNTSAGDLGYVEVDLGSHLKFEDDGVTISQNEPAEGYHVSTQGVTQVVTGSYSFAVTGAAWSPSDSANSGHTVNGSIYQADGFTIQAIGFDTNGNLTQAQVFQTDYRGLSVYSPEASSSIDELASEISIRNGQSEEIVFKLEPGHLAFGINAQLSSLFISGEQGDAANEIAKAVFYRDGKEVGSTTNFTADSLGGHLTTDLTSIPGGFDEVHFIAVDNGTNSNNATNSDFAIQSISFIGVDSAQPIASATGQVTASSADGISDFKLTGLVDDLGYTVTLSDDGHTLTAKDTDDHKVFEVKLSEKTGAWDILQYQNIAKDIQFTIAAIDSDGDSATTTVKLELAGVASEAPTVEITEDSNNDGVISADELNGAIDVKVTLPEGAVVGNTITVSNGTTSTSIVLNAASIAAGFVATTFANPGEGKDINVSATLSDRYGNTSDTGTDSATIHTAVSVSEEGLVNGNPDNLGNPDTTNSATTSGKFFVHESDNLPVSLVLPNEDIQLKSGGVELTWTLSDDGHTLTGSAGDKTILVVTLNGDLDSSGKGSYSVTLEGALDQPSAGEEDTVSVPFEIKVGDGLAVTTQTVTVSIEDDSPSAVTMNATFNLEGVDSYSVSNLAAGFSSSYYYDRNGNNNSDGMQFNNTDNDSYQDAIIWGKTSDSDSIYSSVVVSESVAHSNVSIDDEVIVASITHRNNATSQSEDSFSHSNFNVDVTLTIGGKQITVNLSSLLTINETANNTTNSGDVLTLENSSKTIIVGGVSYNVYLDGFLVNGAITNTVTTPENKTVTYNIAAHVEPIGSVLTSSMSGMLEIDAGADGLDKVIENTTSNNNGTFVTNSNGSYVFTASAALIGSLGKGHSKVVSYQYTVIDNDGDSVLNTINITVNGTGSTVTESSDTTFEDMSHLVDQVYAGTSSIQTGAGYDGNIFNTNWNDGGWSNTLYGGDSSLLKSGNDTIHGNGGNDTIYGRGGNDLLTGDDGNDWIDGGSGNDSISGGAGSDELYGGSGNDLLDGGSGNDYLSGGAGNDILIGGAGDDSLLGGDDNDVLIGGSGNDTLTGGAGADLFVLNNASIDTITDFNAKDDALDLTDLLTGVAGDPGADASADAIASFLSAHVTVTDKHVKVDGSDVATFGSGSNFDSNGSGSVTAADSIKVIYNDQEYNINIDG